MQIVENVFVVPKVVANPYILLDGGEATIIDTGMPGSGKKILAYLAGLGKTARDVKRIIITHTDIDHVGGLAELKKATGARTYASQIEADAIAQGQVSRVIKPKGFSPMRLLFSLMSPFLKVAPFQVDEILVDGQSLPVLGGLQVVATPGHTPGHISLYLPSVGVLFCGDSIVSDEKGLHGSREGVTWDAARAAESVARQAALGARIVCSGHGPFVLDAAGKYPL